MACTPRFNKGVIFLLRKKWFPLLLCVVLCGTFVGCRKTRVHDTSPEFNPETDYNTYYDNYGLGSQFVETEDGYYYTAGLFLRFIDKKSMQSIPLCNKVECSHTMEDSQICSAFRGGIHAKEELFVYKGKLYGFVDDSAVDSVGLAGVYLCELSKDGTSQKKIWEMDWKGGSPGNYISGVLHRGVFYFHIMWDHSISVFGYDMESKKCTLLYDNPDISGCYLTAVGDFLYWREIEVIDDYTEKYTYKRYQISTGEVTGIEKPTHCFATKDKMFFEWYDEEVGKRRIITTDRDGTNYQETDALIDGVGHADDKYLYGHPYWGADFTTVNVYDINTFELVAQLETPEVPEGELLICNLIPTSGDVMFLYDYSRENVYYGYKSEITTGNFQWHKVESAY